MTLFPRSYTSVAPFLTVVALILGQSCGGVLSSVSAYDFCLQQETGVVIPAKLNDQKPLATQEETTTLSQPAENLWSIDLKVLSEAAFIKSAREDKLTPFLNYDLFSSEHTTSRLFYSRDVYSEITKGKYWQAAQKAALELSRLVEENAPWKYRRFQGRE